MSDTNSQKYLSIADLFAALTTYELNYSYNGYFTNELTDSILALAESDMRIESEAIKIKKRVYFIIIELLQNITRHQGLSEDNRLSDGFFSIHKFMGGYLIGSGNMIENKHIPSLSHKLETVNSVDPSELKEWRKKVLISGELSSKGGAGLGLIEMVRKSGNKLSYDFTKIDDLNSYFYFQTKVTDSQLPGFDSDKSHNYDVVKNVHKIVADNNLKIFFQGQFKHENIRNLLLMTEGSMYLKEHFNFRKTSVAIMIELLQNISYHATGITSKDERPGLFMVAENGNSCNLITGNYVEDSDLATLVKKIDFVNSLDDDAIEKIYLDTIVLEKEDHKQGAGLGFIDIRIKSKNKIELETITHHNAKTFIIIKATISY